jgi:hypothetical protein
VVVNTGIIDLEGAVDLICRALKHKAGRLGADAADPGPGAGLPPYAGRQGDFVPPAETPAASAQPRA